MTLCLLTACGSSLSKMQVDEDLTLRNRYAHTKDLDAEVKDLALPMVERGETPGIVVGVLQPDGQTQFFCYGTLEDGKDLKPQPDSLFQVGSLSKGFLGDITASLVEDGVFSWDDNLAKLLPGVKLSEDAKKITLVQLASHSSGLPRQPNNLGQLEKVFTFLFTGDNFYTQMDKDYILAYMSDFQSPAKIEPQYSNIGYALLGYIVELHTKDSLDNLLKDRVLLPLGLNNTGYTPQALPGYAHRAFGHAGDQPLFVSRGTPLDDWKFSGVMKGPAGVYSSAKDLLKYAAAHLSETSSTNIHRALKDTLQVRFQREQDSPAIAWFTDEVEGQLISYQIGFTSGYTSYIGLDKEHQIAVVVLQNSFNWNNIGHKILGRLAQASLKKEYSQNDKNK